MKVLLNDCKVPKEVIIDFLERVTISPNECWNFGNVDDKGYGWFRYGPAHRFILTLFGRDLKSKVVHHVCWNKRCVNPEHLRVLVDSRHKSFHLTLYNQAHPKRYRLPNIRTKPNPLIDPRVT